MGDIGLSRLWCNGGGQMWVRKRRRVTSDFDASARKRVVLTCLDGDEEDDASFSSLNNPQFARTEVGFSITDYMSKCMNTHPSDILMMPFDFGNQIKLMVRNTLLDNSNAGLLYHGLQSIEGIEGEEETNVVHRKAPETSFSYSEKFTNVPHPVTVEKMMARHHDSEPTFLTSTLRTSVMQKEAEVDGMNLRSKVDFHGAISFPEVEEQKNNIQLDAGTHNLPSKATNNRSVESERDLKGMEEIPIIDSSIPEVEIGSLLAPYVASRIDMSPEKDFKRLKTVNFDDMMPTFERETTEHREGQVTYPATELSFVQEKVQNSSPKIKTVNKNVLTPRQQPLCKSLEFTKPAKASNEQQKRKRDHMSVFTKQKLKQSSKKDMHIKEKWENTVANPSQDQLEPKVLPNFESFVVVEEGSGGYGTVYRALRKSDRQMFAIKCMKDNTYISHSAAF